MGTLLNKLSDIEKASTESLRRTRMVEAKQKLSTYKLQRTPYPVDPKYPSHRGLRGKPDNKPKLKKPEFTASGLYNTPMMRLAALGDFRYDALPGASDPAYPEGNG